MNKIIKQQTFYVVKSVTSALEKNPEITIVIASPFIIYYINKLIIDPISKIANDAMDKDYDMDVDINKNGIHIGLKKNV